MNQIRVLIVDDSAFVRRAVERMLHGMAGVTVVGSAANGADAVDRVKDLKPDVVILDVNMPHVDGLEALRRIMLEAPTGVLMLSTQTGEGARTTLLALDLGAVDFLDKSTAGSAMNIYSLTPILREKVLAVADAAVTPPESEGVLTPPLVKGPSRPSQFEIVAIGASTGGPRALGEILTRLPGEFPVGIVIAQHMPAGFTTTLAERFDRRSALAVSEAADGGEVKPGSVLIAPGGRQITLIRKDGGMFVRVDDGPSNLLHRPSVDLLFGSAAEVVGARAIGVVLTGMGDDGARGLRILRDAGARTIAESRESAVIFGMPRAAAPAADLILPLREMSSCLTKLVAGELSGSGRAS